MESKYFLKDRSLQHISIKIIAENPSLIPQYASKGSSGADVKAFIPDEIVIPEQSVALIPTGLKFEIPEGYEIQVRPRSGLALKEQITVLNTPGTIDADYRGELKIILINLSKKPFIVQPGMRIAQIVVAPVVQALFEETECISVTERGNHGFGHSGVL